jgi:hypothetical protein
MPTAEIQTTYRGAVPVFEDNHLVGSPTQSVPPIPDGALGFRRPKG